MRTRSRTHQARQCAGRQERQRAAHGLRRCNAIATTNISRRAAGDWRGHVRKHGAGADWPVESLDRRAAISIRSVLRFTKCSPGRCRSLASDPMEWIHCHIAHRPTPLAARGDGIPAVVEVWFLSFSPRLAKSATRLPPGPNTTCASVWAGEAHHSIDAFLLATHDASDRILMPGKSVWTRGADRSARDRVQSYCGQMWGGIHTDCRPH